METLKSPQAEMNSIIGKRRVLEPLTWNTLRAADRKHKTDEKIIVFSENRTEWTGPLEVVNAKGRKEAVYNKYRTWENIQFLLEKSVLLQLCTKLSLY